MGGQVHRESFGPYRIERVLARGGMGVVYVARLPDRSARRVALKRLRADVRAVPAFVARFERECAIARAFSHPNLVRCLDAGKIDGIPFMASELVVGPDLGTLVREQGPLPPGLALRVALDLATGLEQIHGARSADGAPRGLVHRDVAPGNVLIGLDGVTKLADFGLAKSELFDVAALTETGTVLGTPRFLAPERLSDETPGPASDVYGLGAVLHFALAGSGPYEGNPQEILEQLVRAPPEPLARRRPELEGPVAALVGAFLARSPRDRPPDAGAARRRLVELGDTWTQSQVGGWVGARYGALAELLEPIAEGTASGGTRVAAAPARPTTRASHRAECAPVSSDSPASVPIGFDLGTEVPPTEASPAPLESELSPFGEHDEASWEEVAEPTPDLEWSAYEPSTVAPEALAFPDPGPTERAPAPLGPAPLGSDFDAPLDATARLPMSAPDATALVRAPTLEGPEGPAGDRRRLGRVAVAAGLLLLVVVAALRVARPPSEASWAVAERLGAARVRAERLEDAALRRALLGRAAQIRAELAGGETSGLETRLEALERALEAAARPEGRSPRPTAQD